MLQSRLYKGVDMDYYIKEQEMLIEKQKRVRKEIVNQYINARKEKKMTQEELSERMNVKRPNISRFESGEYNPTVDMLVKMAECLEMDLVIELKTSKED